MVPKYNDTICFDSNRTYLMFWRPDGSSSLTENLEFIKMVILMGILG